MIRRLACLALAISCALGCASEVDDGTTTADREAEAIRLKNALFQFRDKQLVVNDHYVLCPSVVSTDGHDAGPPPFPRLIDTRFESCESRFSLDLRGTLWSRGYCVRPSASLFDQETLCSDPSMEWTFKRPDGRSGPLVGVARGTCLTADSVRKYVYMTACNGSSAQSWSLRD
jgi:hypothetical protein